MSVVNYIINMITQLHPLKSPNNYHTLKLEQALKDPFLAIKVQKLLDSAHIEVHSILGEAGYYGSVFLAENKITGQPFTIKLLDYDPKTLSRKRFWYTPERGEAVGIGIQEHKGLTQTLALIVMDSNHDLHWIHSEQELKDFANQEPNLLVVAILGEYIKGAKDFFYAIYTDKDIHPSEATAIYFGRQIADALSNLNKQNVLFRDLKPENILLTPELTIKLIDYGFAIKKEGALTDNTICGTTEYYPPEICLSDIHETDNRMTKTSYNEKVDSWSLGVVLFELACGYQPWPKGKNGEKAPVFKGIRRYTEEIENAYRRISSSNLEESKKTEALKQIAREQLPLQDSIKLSEDFIELLTDLLHPKADMRISTHEAALRLQKLHPEKT